MNRTTSKNETLPPDAEAQLKHLQEVTKPYAGKWPHSILCSCAGCALLETYSPAMRNAAIHMLQTGEFPILTQPEPVLERAPNIPAPLQAQELTNSVEKETKKTSEAPLPAEQPQPSAIQVDFSENTSQTLSVPPQLPGEPHDSYDGLLEYCQNRNSGPLGELADDLGISRATLFRYKKTYRWDERLREFKQRQIAASTATIEPILKEQAKVMATSVQELKAFQWNLAKLQFQRAYAVLSDATADCSIKDAALLVQVASKIGQAAISDNTPALQEDTGLTKFEQLVHEFAARQKQAITESDLTN